MLADNFVHQWLSRRWLVGFVVTATAITNQIDNHIFTKLVAVIHGQHSRKHHCVWVVAIDVQNRRLNHLGDICTVFCGAGVILAASGKADLIIDHNMDGATGFIGASLRQLERLHHNTLTRKGCIAVHQDWYNLFAFHVVTTILTGATRTHYYGARNF